MPGETAYVVLDENGEPLETEADLADPDRGARRRRRPPWWDDAWDSVELAGNPPEAGRRRRRPRSTGPTSRPDERAGDRPAPTRRRSRPSSAASPAAIHEVGHRCPCGHPDVVTTEPRLPDGTPFPTTFYLTCPRAASRIGTLEGSGLMKEMQDRLGDRPRARGGLPRGARALPRGRATALGHGARDRRASPPAGCPTGSSACTCSPASRSPQGRGVNPLGDEVLDLLGDWWAAGPCVDRCRGAMTRRRRDRLRHQLDQAADRRPARTSRCREIADGPARPGRRPHRAARRRGAGADVRRDRRVRRADRRARRRRGSGSAPPRRPATPPTRDVFVAGVAARLGVEPEVVSGRRGGRAVFAGAVRNLRADAGRAGAGRRHRRRLDRAGPRRGRRPTPRTRWTSARSGCTSGTCTPTRRPPPRSRPASADIDAAPRRAARSTRPTAATVVGVAGTSPRWPRRCSTCRRTTATRSTRPCSPSPTCTRSSTGCSR